jgi:hypothetical protein
MQRNGCEQKDAGGDDLKGVVAGRHREGTQIVDRSRQCQEAKERTGDRIQKLAADRVVLFPAELFLSCAGCPADLAIAAVMGRSRLTPPTLPRLQDRNCTAK